jgi:putative sterol carrier protein
MPTVKEIFEAMPGKFKKDAAAGMNAVYQYDVTGDGGGKWYTEISNGELKVVEGDHASPNITITIKDTDYVDLVGGKLNGQTAFLTGKLKIKGDMSLAMKLNSLFQQG